MRTHARAWPALAIVGSAAAACAVLVGVNGGIASGAAPAPAAQQAPAAAVADTAGAFRLDPGSAPAPVESRVAPAVQAERPAPKAAAKPAPKPAGKPAATKPTAKVAGTPCTAAARACVDLDDREAWLIDDGKVVRGPVGITHGDDEDPTPTGTFHVQWKAEQYTSREYLTQMPYSVFFADGGVAFHQGNQETPSAGCVKLEEDDAQAFFAFLQVGDEVQVH